MSTSLPTYGKATVVTPRIGGGQNPNTYWVGGRNILSFTIANSIHARRPNNFCSAYIVVTNCTEGLPGEKKISLDESKSNSTTMSWVAWIWSYI